MDISKITYDPIKDIRINKIYEYYDQPLLYSFYNTTGTLFLAYLCDIEEAGEDGETEIWLYTPVSQMDIRQIEKGKVSVRDAILYSRMTFSYICRICDGSANSYSVIENASIPLDCLPDQDFFIESNADESGGDWKLLDRTVLENGRYAADIELVFDENHDVHEIDIDYMTRILSGLQNYVCSVAMGPRAKASSKITKEIREVNQLVLSRTRAASFEFRIESKSFPTLFLDDPFPSAMEYLVSALSDPGKGDFLKSLSEKSFNELKTLVYSLKKQRVSGVVKFAKPTPNDAVEELSSRFDEEVLDGVLRKMNELVLSSRMFELPAKLTGVHIESRKFWLVGLSEGSLPISGLIAKDLLEYTFTVESFGEAYIAETQETEASGCVTSKYELINWTERPEGYFDNVQ